jgi:hypothetical protein
MNKYTHTCSALAMGMVLLLSAACSPNTYITHAWKNPDQGNQKNHVFVAAISEDRAAKATVENQLVYVLKDIGVDATSSLSIFRPDQIKKDLDDDQRELMLEQIRAKGCDAIMTIALLEETSETRYIPGNTDYVPAIRYNFYNGFYTYYNHYYPVITSPGYYTQDKTYFLETNFYDAATKDLLWSAQTETYNPNNIDTFAEELSSVLIARLKREGLINSTVDQVSQ